MNGRERNRRRPPFPHLPLPETLRGRHWNGALGAGAGIVLCVFLAYGNALRNGFVWDDETAVERNRFITDWGNFPALFSRAYLSNGVEIEKRRDSFSGSGEVTYRPLVTLSYMIDYSLWRKWPAGYHASNIALHALNAALVAAFVFALFRQGAWALAAGLIFGLHPAATEAVDGVSFREDVLCLFFFVPALLCFVAGWRSERSVWLLGALAGAFTLLACLSKEMGVTVSLVAGAICLLAPRRPWNARRAFMLAAPCVAVVLYLLVYFVVMRNPDEPPIGYYGGRMDIHVAAMLKTFGYYLRILVIPVGLCADPFIEPSERLANVAPLVALLGLAAIAAAAIWTWRRSQDIAFGVVWFVLTMLPVSGLAPLRHVAAERYLYVPLPGLAMLIGWGLLRLVSASRALTKWRQCGVVVYAASLGVLLLVLGGLTFRRNAVWRDRESLWSATVAVNPRSFFAQYALANSEMARDDYARAEERLKTCIELAPGSSTARNNLGLCYFRTGQYKEAAQQFLEVIRLDPRGDKAYNNLGLVYEHLKQDGLAEDSYKKALEINPCNPNALSNLGGVYLRQGRDAEAIAVLRRALALNPDLAQTHRLLAVIYERQGDKARASRHRAEYERLTVRESKARGGD